MTRLAILQESTHREFLGLVEKYPELERRGLTLFLGKHYACESPRIMMLGINPGLAEDCPVDLALQPENCLLGNATEGRARKFRYWRNARRCFGSTDDLQKLMQFATFSFCSPFRTPRWVQTPPEMRSAIVLHSKPILRQMLSDCQPTSVILGGKLSVGLFARVGGVELTVQASDAGGTGVRTWAAFSATGRWGDYRVLQVPHFSVFNSKKGLRECGVWLASQLTVS